MSLCMLRSSTRAATARSSRSPWQDMPTKPVEKRGYENPSRQSKKRGMARCLQEHADTRFSPARLRSPLRMIMCVSELSGARARCGRLGRGHGSRQGRKVEERPVAVLHGCQEEALQVGRAGRLAPVSSRLAAPHLYSFPWQPTARRLLSPASLPALPLRGNLPECACSKQAAAPRSSSALWTPSISSPYVPSATRVAALILIALDSYSFGTLSLTRR